MTEFSSGSGDNYQVGGSLPADAPSYVRRASDDLLYDALRADKFCYVLNSRQMGKSSLKVQMIQRLQAEGVACAAIDLTRIGAADITAEQWYSSVIDSIVGSLDLYETFDLYTWWEEHRLLSNVRRLDKFIEEILLTSTSQKIVIFIDEIDSVIGLPFKLGDFFALVRECYNRRANHPDYGRLTFVLLGVTTLSDLMQGQLQTPFNIGQEIALEGFQLDECESLVQGLAAKSSNPQALMHAILTWTGGQPFLTQKVCKLVLHENSMVPDGQEEAWVTDLVRVRVIENWEAQDTPEHLKTIRDRVLYSSDEKGRGRLLGLYQQVLGDESPLASQYLGGQDDDKAPSIGGGRGLDNIERSAANVSHGIEADDSYEQIQLRLTGLVVKRGSRLVVYNPIYGLVFNHYWVSRSLADLRPEFYGSAFREWEVAEKKESFLLRGEALQNAEEWARGKRLSNADEQFLRESRENFNQIVQLYAQRSEANFNRLIKFALVGTVISLCIMAFLAFQANRQRLLAESGEIEALISSAQSSFLLNRHLESLTTAIQSAKKLNVIAAGEDKTRITELTFEALQNIIYNMRERYRFNPEKLDSPFYVAKFSPDGNILAFGSYDGGVYLFQRNGKPISRLVGYKVKYVRSLSFSPDGKKIASVGKGKNVRIWDVPYGMLIAKFYAHKTDISKVSFHPNGKLLLTGSFDGTVKLWDSDRGIEIRTLTPKSPNLKPLNTANNATNPQSPKVSKQEAAPIQDVSFSPDGKWIVIAKDTVISIWDLEGNLIADTVAHDNKIYSVNFHPQGKMLASSGGDNTVKLWKIVERPLDNPTEVLKGFANPEAVDRGISLEPPQPDQNKWSIELLKTYTGNLSDVLSLNFSSDGRHIAFGSQDNSIQVLNLDGTIEMKLGGHTAGIFDVSFSPDGRYLISASKDRTARLWDLKATLLDTIYGHTDTVWSVNFRPDGQVFASGSVDKTVRIWNADGTLKQQLLGHEGIVYGVSYSPDGKKLVSSSTDKTVRVWDAETGKLLNLLNIHGAELIYATFSPDQKILATLGSDNKIKLWQWDDTNNPRLLQVLDGHTKEVWGISFSPDSGFIAATSNDQTVKVWNVNNGQNVMTMESAHVNGGLAIAYSRDGKLIGSAGKDGKLKLWNAQTGILEKEITSEDGSWIYGINFSPDGKAIATATQDKKIKIIDLDTGETFKTLIGHTAEVNSVTYSPNGKTLISASRDNTLKVWNAEALTFNELVQRGCSLLENYLLYSPTVKPEQKQICKL